MNVRVFLIAVFVAGVVVAGVLYLVLVARGTKLVPKNVRPNPVTSQVRPVPVLSPGDMLYPRPA